VGRTQYRPDPWKVPEWAVAVSGIIPAVVLVTGIGFDPALLDPSINPLRWPSMPLVPALAIAVAAVAAVAAPPPVRSVEAGTGTRPSSLDARVRGDRAGHDPDRIEVPA
jgi:energy-coupling factor transport system permease protein